jgi:hypothetical protein
MMLARDMDAEQLRTLAKFCILSFIGEGAEYKILELKLFLLTRAEPGLQKVLPFYWGASGPTCDMLPGLLVDLMDNNILVSPWDFWPVCRKDVE